MAHAQSSPRGLIAKQRFDVGVQQLTDGTTYLNLNNGIRISGLAGGLLTADASYLIVPAGVKVGAGSMAITANSTTLTVGGAVKPTSASAAPATRYGPGAILLVTNSTGKQLAVNTTGTTWAYTQLTSVLA